MSYTVDYDSFCRKNNSDYYAVAKEKKTGEKHIIKVHSKLSPSSKQVKIDRVIASFAMGLFAKGKLKKAKFISLKDSQYKIQVKDPVQVSTKFLKILTNITHLEGAVNETYIEITSANNLNSNSNNILKLNYEDKDEVNQCENTLNNVSLISHIKSTKPFDDPFTKLATEAFQWKESKFYPEKNGEGIISDTVIVALPDSGKTVLKCVQTSQLSEILGKHKYAVSEAKKIYWNYVNSEYGEEKINYILHKYGIEKNKESITPNLIYRMNIGFGATNETHEVKTIFNEYRKLARQNIEDDTKLVKFFDGKVNIGDSQGKDFLPISWARKTLEILGREQNRNIEDLTFFDFKMWVSDMESDAISNKASTIDIHHLSPKYTSMLVDHVMPTDEERKRMYTGKEVVGIVGTSGYDRSGFGLKTHKPWADDQLMSQTNGRLKNDNPSEARKYEEHAFCTVKYNLENKHPTELYRVGNLIYGGTCEDGYPVYHYVASMSNNNSGITSYMLEPFGAGTGLGSILLNKSTASDPYAKGTGGTESVWNDLNLFNPPGYMGREKIDRQPLIDHSIPVWVGYGISAQRLLRDNNTELAFESLKNANLAFCKLNFLPYKPMSTKDRITKCIRDNDHFLNKMLYSLVFKGTIQSVQNTLELFQRYSYMGDGPHSDEQAFEDAIAIEEILKTIPNAEFFEEDIQKFCAKLTNAIKATDERTVKKLNANKKLKSLIQPLIEFEVGYKKIKSDDNLSKEDERNFLCKWSRAILQTAMTLGENPSQKKKKTSICGHSLGGAIGVEQMTYFSENHRMPVPDEKSHKKNTIDLWAFDNPGGRKDECQYFMQFYNEHNTLLEMLKVGFSVSLNHERGDIVPTGGQWAPGVARNKHESKESDSWLNFECVVRDKLQEATWIGITQWGFKHETQFLGGIPGLDYRETNLTKEQMKMFYDAQTQEEEDFVASTWGIFEGLQKITNLPIVKSFTGGNNLVSGQVHETLLSGKRMMLMQLLLQYKDDVDREFLPEEEWKNYLGKNGEFKVNLDGVFLDA